MDNKTQKATRNLLKVLQKNKKMGRRKKTILITASSIVLAILAIGFFIAYLSYPKAQSAVTHIQNAKTEMEQAQQQLVAQNFEEGRENLNEASSEINKARKIFDSFSWLKIVPVARTQYYAISYVFDSVDHLIAGVRTLTDVGESVLKPLQSTEANNIDSISVEERQQILQALIDAKPKIESVQEEFDIAAELIEKIPQRGLLASVRTSIEPIQEQVPALQETAQQLVPLSQSLPSFLGYPEQKEYLLLFQNNTELRPTGGFIGTYGIIKMRDGEIISVESDNVYNLDDAALKNGLSIEPPSPLFQYNGVKKWFLRDSNWSPDFPTSAQKALEFYGLEGGSETNIDGVIAIDPSFIASLLEISGPTTVRGITFTSENFVDKLQEHVTQGFQSQGIESPDRKDIIGELGDELMKSIFSLKKSRWPELFLALEKNLGEKHILLWMENQELQEVLASQGWDGHIEQDMNRQDIMIIDANLASLKTDPAVGRNTKYKIFEDDRGYQITVERTYTNTGKLTWKTTRYRTYARVYVPQGSELLSSSGKMVDCKNGDEGPINTQDELGHTVYAFFVCVEPGESKTVTLSYRLPPDRFNQKLYKEYMPITFVKQPGTPGDTIQLEYQSLKNIDRVEPTIDNFQKLSNTHILLEDILKRDTTVTFIY